MSFKWPLLLLLYLGKLIELAASEEPEITFGLAKPHMVLHLRYSAGKSIPRIFILAKQNSETLL